MNEEIDFSIGKRGAIDPLPAGKTRVIIRLDDDLLDWFGRRCMPQVAEIIKP